MTEALPTSAPRHIGKYRLDGMLGKGAMGVVYRAFDPLIERTVALKTVRRDLGDDEQAREMIERFRKEAQAAGRLMHPNIVAVHEYGESDDIAFIAMEYIDGTPLSSLIGDQPCPLPQALAWIGDLLAALDYSHERGVVHRDIKPANLLVTRDGRIKVGDFGIARVESSTLTQNGAMLGTPSYMSPEQFRGEPIDGRSDLFAAGIVLYQLLTGKRPFAGSTATVMLQVLNHTPPQPSSLNAALPPAIDAVVMRALSKDAGQRHATAREFQLALSALRDGGGWDGAEHDSDATILAPSHALMSQSLTSQPGWAHHRPQQSRHGTAGTGGGTGGASWPDWMQAVAAPLEAILTRQIGPMAKLLLRKIAATSSDFDNLGQQLLLCIPSPAARSLFEQQLAAIRAEHFPVTRGSASGDSGGGGDSSNGNGNSSGGSANLAGNATTASTGGTGAGTSPSSATHPSRVLATTQTTMATPPAALTPEFAATVTPVLAAAVGPIAAILVKRALRTALDRDDFVALLTTHIDAPAARGRFLEQAGRLRDADQPPRPPDPAAPRYACCQYPSMAV